MNAETFWQQTMAVETGCWLWTRATADKGYGVVWFNGRQDLTHRVAYKLAVGPIPDGCQIDHLCRVHECIRPTHLEAVSRQENLRRGIHRNAIKTHCLRGHEFDQANTIWIGPWRRCRTCVNDRRRKGTTNAEA